MQPKRLCTAEDLDIHDIEWLWAAVDGQSERTGPPVGNLLGVPISLIFAAPSTRTAAAFCAAAHELGAMPIVLTHSSSRLESGESLEDTIHAISGMIGGLLVVRGPIDTACLKLAIPLANAGDNREHPTQALVDLFAMTSILHASSPSEMIDFSMVVLMPNGALVRPVVSLLRLCRILARGSFCVVCESEEQRVEFMQMGGFPAGTKLEVASGRHAVELAQGAEFAYLLESYDGGGNIQLSEWLISLLPKLSESVILHPLPRSARVASILANMPKVAIETQLALHVPVKKGVLRWLVHH